MSTDEAKFGDTVSMRSYKFNRSCSVVRLYDSDDLAELNGKMELLQNKLGSAEEEEESALTPLHF